MTSFTSFRFGFFMFAIFGFLAFFGLFTAVFNDLGKRRGRFGAGRFGFG